jgi:phenylpropionate dioxygenase-like ring-hydroxylating dioxygenase large terminal subunit
MIPNQWYAILDSREVKTGKPVGVKRLGERLVLWRDENGQVACMQDQCVHRGAALSAGKLVDHHIQCPFHGLEYDASGKCVYIPAISRSGIVPKVFCQRAYPTRELQNFIWIWWGEPRSDLPPIRWFDSIDDSFVYDTLVDPWPTHYSRAIENQLDVIHLPFVHYNTIGRGDRRVVDGPIVRWDKEDPDLMSLWVYNRVDDGVPPRKADQIPEPTRHPQLQFHMPNFWQNWIGDDMRIVAFFVPVDEENMIMYLRLYQRTVKAPILKQIFNFFGKISNLVIERQDKRVVVTQRPYRTFNRMGESLLQGDSPIILYRRRREELINVAKGLDQK